MPLGGWLFITNRWGQRALFSDPVVIFGAVGES